MTTIATDGRRMVADTRAVHGATAFKTRKLYRVGSAVVGISGGFEDGLRFVQWLADGCPREDVPVTPPEEFGALVLDTNGVFKYEGEWVPMPILEQTWAVGSGADFAVAAMRCGATVEDAVKVACGLDVYSGLPLDVEVL